MSKLSSRLPPPQLLEPAARPRARQRPAPAAAAAPRGRLAIAVVSTLTGLWLASQLLVGLLLIVPTWPIAAFPMFSQQRWSIAQRELEATTRSGRVVRLGPRDFGLTELQLRNVERTAVGETGTVTPTAPEVLARLAGAWNRRHPGDPAVALVLTNRVHPLEPGAPPSSQQVVRWSAP